MSQSESRENNRKFPRMALELSCTIARAGVNGSEGQKLRVKAWNMGPGGLLLQTDSGLTPGEILQILFMIDGQRIEAKGRVVNVKPAAGGGFENGVAFTRIMPEHRDFLLATILLRENGDPG